MHEERHCKNLKDHCYFHNEDELVTATSYKVCYNCFHVFQTMEELIDLADQNDPPEDTVFRTANISDCPLCRMPFVKDRHILISGKNPLEE